MPIEISIAGARAEEELRSLHAWLANEPEIRRTARLVLRSAPSGPGEMGTAIDVLQLITDNVWNATSLAIAVGAWQNTRSVPTRVTVRRGSVEVTLTGADPEEIAHVARRLQQPEDGGQ